MNAQQPPGRDAFDEPSELQKPTTLFREVSPLPRSGTAAETPEDQATVSLSEFRSDQVPTLRKSSGGDAPAMPTRLAQYEIIAEIARGGMGVVYEARDCKLNRVVALKTLKTPLIENDEGVLRFQREAYAAARLNHPHIVPIHDFGQQGNILYYTMALVDGRTLTACRDRYTRDIRAAVDLVRKAALAVAYAHERGVLHRDLKPSNILVDGHGEPRIADFGLAKFLEDQQREVPSAAGNGTARRSVDPVVSQAGQVVGTPAYMAPEQFRGRSDQLGPACDIWALGIILFELLAGNRPFRGATTRAIRNAVLQDEPPRLRRLNPKVDPGLEAVVLKCLEKNPSHRFASARELAEELDRWLHDQPLKTQPRTWTDRVRRALRRRMPTVALVSFLALLGGLLVANFGSSSREVSEDILTSQENFDLRGEIQLVGPVGPPKAFRIARGDAGFVAKPDACFVVHSLYESLIELLPGPMPENFVFEAEMQQAYTQFMGEFGLYVARTQPLDKDHDWYLNFTLADLGSTSVVLTAADGQRGSWIRLGRVYHRPPAPGAPVSPRTHLSLEHSWHVPPQPWADRGPWRRLTVRVVNDHLSFLLDGEERLAITRQDLQRRSQESAATDTAHPALIWPTEGGLGLYVTRCTVCVRNVRVQRLGN